MLQMTPENRSKTPHNWMKVRLSDSNPKKPWHQNDTLDGKNV